MVVSAMWRRCPRRTRKPGLLAPRLLLTALLVLLVISTAAASKSSPRSSNGGPRSPATLPGGRRPPRQEQSKHQQQRRPASQVSEQDGDDDSDPGFAFDIDSFEDDDEEDDDEDDDVWSDEGDSDSWSDEDDDGDEDDWGRGAAGGPGGRGRRSGGRDSGRGKARRAGAGGRGAMGTKSGAPGIGMSGWRDRINQARQRASSAYREAKSLMSSEMEGVVLKATRPDDLPVKPKHLEALMRPTAEMPKEFNVYLPVVRKLWSKMADKEWRVSAKALYIVHRFAADGSIEHATNLKESVAVLRTHHDSKRKVHYFDMDTICDVKAPSWSVEDVAPMKEFLRGYAEFVLRRTTQFGPDFRELLDTFAMLEGQGEIITAVEGLVSAGWKCCQLRNEQEGAISVAATLQVAQDVRDVVEVCAAQLEYLARELQAGSVYPSEVDRWYTFLYSNRETVEALIGRANALAEKHKLTSLRPLLATPVVLELRDEEIALEQKTALEAEQERCAAEKREQKPKVSPPADLTKVKRNLKRSSDGDSANDGAEGGVRSAIAGASVRGRTQDARRRAESAFSSDTAAPAVGPKKARTAEANDRARTRPKSTTSPTSDGGSVGSSARKTSVSAGTTGGVQRSAVRRPPESEVEAEARAATRREGDAHGGGGVTKKVARSAGNTSTAEGKVKSRVSKKKRPSSISKKSQGGEERQERPSPVKGSVERGGSVTGGRSSAGGSGVSQPKSSTHKRKRQDRPTSGSSPRSG
ncbi:unnamed protein product [Scytosiphon promiscuus]